MRKSLLNISLIGTFLLIGCSEPINKKGVPALFNTKEEAEDAAKHFNCTGAHKMGEEWMPCKQHGHHEHHHNH